MRSAPLSARVALVGPESESSVNLGLRVLAAALRAEGHQAVLFPFGSPHEFERVAQAIVMDRPDAVGISINHEYSTLLSGALMKRLRELGFEKLIVAGGLVATLKAKELLTVCTELDAVVRHRGEQAIVIVAEAAIGRRDLREAPGILLRQDDSFAQGAPCDVTGRSLWPWRGTEGLPKRLGLPVASMMGSRGCARSCPFCSIVTLRQNAENLIPKTEALSVDSVPCHRRSAKDIASEMAALVFEYGARVFEFQDDSFLPDDTQQAVTFLQDLRSHMQMHALPSCAIRISMHQDQVTREVCNELANLGVIRATVDIKAASLSLAQRLHSDYSPSLARVVLGRLRRLGIATSFQSLIIGPETTLEEIEDELEACSTIRGVPFELTRLHVFGGTILEQRLHDQKRLRDCFYFRKIDFADSRVAQLDEWMSLLKSRYVSARSPIRRIIDLGYDIAIANRFFPHAGLFSLESLAARLVSRTNADQIHTARALIHLIRRGHTHENDIEPILRTAIRQDEALSHTIHDVAEILEEEIQASGGQSPWADDFEPSELSLRLAELDADTAIMERPTMNAANAENRCAEIASRPCLGPIRHSEAEEEEPLFSRTLPRIAPASMRAIIEVSNTGRARLVELADAQGIVDTTDTAHRCVDEHLERFDMTCFAGERLIFEDPYPTT